MSWEDDPQIQQARRERAVRMGIVRTALIWTPFFLVTGGAFLFFLYDQLFGEERGTWFLIVVLAGFATLFGFQSLQAVFDLFGQPKEVRGVVTRRWARSDSFVFRTHYVRIGGRILRGDRDLLMDVKAGDEVTVRYYPHSAVIVALERMPRARDGGDDAETATQA
ncbi:MAG: hypothetical protein IT304_03420 [Dehalococcoidia bacterium]|nr:hypothetical protein [Dehalococcoidia bacterium]